jgi:hypothetical protein
VIRKRPKTIEPHAASVSSDVPITKAARTAGRAFGAIGERVDRGVAPPTRRSAQHRHAREEDAAAARDDGAPAVRPTARSPRPSAAR